MTTQHVDESGAPASDDILSNAGFGPDVDTAQWFDSTNEEAVASDPSWESDAAGLVIRDTRPEVIEEVIHGDTSLDPTAFDDQKIRYADVHIPADAHSLTVTLRAPERYVIPMVLYAAYDDPHEGHLSDLAAQPPIAQDIMGNGDMDGFSRGATEVEIPLPEDAQALMLSIGYNYHPNSPRRQAEGNYSIYMVRIHRDG